MPTGYPRRAFCTGRSPKTVSGGRDRGSAFAGALIANRGPTSTFFGIVPDINIWRVANLMIKRYGDLAEVESARRADEPWEVGDAAGVAVWRRLWAPYFRLGLL